MDWDADTLLRERALYRGTIELVVNRAPSSTTTWVGASWEYCGPAYGEAVAGPKSSYDFTRNCSRPICGWALRR